MNTLEQKKANRFRYLNRLYEITNGDSHKFVPADELGAELGLDREQSLAIAQYLKGEGLIEYRTFGPTISITHYGVVEVERAVSEPDTPTHYFPPVNIINVGSMVNSQISQASTGSSQAQQIDQSDTEAILAFVNGFRDQMHQLQLTLDARIEADADIATVEAQLASSRPKARILRESLSSLRTILEGAAGSAVASDLLPKLLPILASLSQAA